MVLRAVRDMGRGRASGLAPAVAIAAAACSSPPEFSPDGGDAPDAGPPADAAPADAAAPDASTVRMLSQMGLYEDIDDKSIHPEAIEYEPAYALWSDGAEKSRWLLLPDGETIDTSDMDRWQFPVGTRAFKEFRVDGTRVETRLIEKRGEDEFWFGAFVWNEDESDAAFAEFGERDALGTGHDVPSALQCLECHEGEPDRVLGFSAVQLSHEGDSNLGSIADRGLLSEPPPEGEDYPPPGDETTREALGYLHANCGNCHNPQGPAWADAEMNLRLSVGEATPEDTAIHATAVGVETERFSEHELRVDPGSPDTSALHYRMSVTSDVGRDRMPPLATDDVDERGLAAVGAWIESLAAE